MGEVGEEKGEAEEEKGEEKREERGRAKEESCTVLDILLLTLLLLHLVDL